MLPREETSGSDPPGDDYKVVSCPLRMPRKSRFSCLSADILFHGFHLACLVYSLLSFCSHVLILRSSTCHTIAH